MIEQVMNDPTAGQIFIIFVYRLFFVFGIIAFAVGVGLIVNHARTRRFCDYMNRWVSTRPATKWLAISQDTAAAEHRFRYSIGAVSILLAGFSVFVLIAQIDAERVAAAIPLNVPRAFEVLMIESVRRILIAGGLFAIAVGLMLIFFPKALRAIETRANRWYSTRTLVRNGDRMHVGFDQWLDGNPRVAGWIITSGALIVVVNFGILLLRLT
ncbi:MAG: hypothetical protein FD157_2912 [Rhodocyclaceae bacterium]|nr:MAG: hypothetical protein FD157_2912 [Rhodocyclaceae bacterium]TND03837.1 MAG: hypothetical protein FD118_1255 [Rhodocyclaceae bacterium]